jgi:hypothetical protein
LWKLVEDVEGGCGIIPHGGWVCNFCFCEEYSKYESYFIKDDVFVDYNVIFTILKALLIS